MPGRSDEQAAVLALVAVTDDHWRRTASLIEDVGSATRILQGEWTGFEPDDAAELHRLAEAVPQEDLARYRDMILGLEDGGVGLVTILDPDYPRNLRQVFNRPPFLFTRGRLVGEDDRAVAVVGTRRASPQGLAEARTLASRLAREGVTVLSGLAEGIDTAAHEAALDAGGRTIAVLGTGIAQPIYPKSNEGLARRAEGQGALVSQFWPDAPPTRQTFPMRNAVMSGMGIGTAVIEASHTSGAKGQARLALQHGKRLFLVESLVLREEWAQRYSRHPAAVVVRSADEIMEIVTKMVAPVKQLSLA